MAAALDLSEDILAIVKDITRFDGSHIGFAGSKSENYEAAEKLWAACSTADLAAVAASHSNPATRCYALEGLYNRTKEGEKAAMDWLRTLKDGFRSDQTTVTTMSGCCMGNETVSDASDYYFQQLDM
mmetsp:Transcript_2600/g.3167  ORF Transcript_2600/g.3167 Transcript_2600/m.3167 type:complete len:127 (-) Transcript_2600:103-483(-)